MVVTNDINIKKYLVRIDDINIYINDELESLLEDDRYHGFYEGAKLYLPSYIDLEDKEYLTHCYFFDGTLTLSHNGTSLILELQFEDRKTLDEFVINEKMRVEYDDSSDWSYNGYSIYFTSDPKYTRNTPIPKKFPFSSGMLCVNYEKLTLRIGYYYKIGGSSKSLKEIFEFTSCVW